MVEECLTCISSGEALLSIKQNISKKIPIIVDGVRRVQI